MQHLLTTHSGPGNNDNNCTIWPCRCIASQILLPQFPGSEMNAFFPITFPGNAATCRETRWWCSATFSPCRWCTTMQRTSTHCRQQSSRKTVFNKLSTFIPFGSVRWLSDWIWIVLATIVTELSRQPSAGPPPYLPGSSELVGWCKVSGTTGGKFAGDTNIRSHVNWIQKFWDCRRCRSRIVLYLGLLNLIEDTSSSCFSLTKCSRAAISRILLLNFKFWWTPLI